MWRCGWFGRPEANRCADRRTFRRLGLCSGSSADSPNQVHLESNCCTAADYHNVKCLKIRPILPILPIRRHHRSRAGEGHSLHHRCRCAFARAIGRELRPTGGENAAAPRSRSLHVPAEQTGGARYCSEPRPQLTRQIPFRPLVPRKIPTSSASLQSP